MRFDVLELEESSVCIKCNRLEPCMYVRIINTETGQAYFSRTCASCVVGNINETKFKGKKQ